MNAYLTFVWLNFGIGEGDLGILGAAYLIWRVGN